MKHHPTELSTLKKVARQNQQAKAKPRADSKQAAAE
jgi:hypothetical protein